MARTHVVVGAGPIGTGLVTALVDRGDRVRVVTRSGGGPDHPRVERVALDASSADALAAVCAGAESLVNCVNPPYHRWSQTWPALSRAFVTAAERSGAFLVHASNLYMYGAGVEVMAEDSPETSAPGTKGAVRAAVWAESLAAHRAGRVRAVEVRASDYFGAGSGSNSHLDLEILRPIVRGRTPVVLQGDRNAPHSWTSLPDLTATLLAAIDAERDDGRAAGRVLHVPNAPARSIVQVAADVAELLGGKPRRPVIVPRPVLAAVGLAVPFVRELREVGYQFHQPFVATSSATEELLGVRATPWETALRADVLANGGTPVR